MVEALFRHRKPKTTNRVLDPGCGLGAFIDGILRWCRRDDAPVPEIVGVESDPKLLEEAWRRFRGNAQVHIHAADFLKETPGRFDFVIGNPPYVAITRLDEAEKAAYRAGFHTATGRFDLYFLFFEQAIKAMCEGARLVFITPEKFLYVDSAAALRQLLARTGVRSVTLVDEGTFPGLITYPAITTVEAAESGSLTEVTDRRGVTRRIRLPADGASWLPRILGQDDRPGYTLEHACARISAGVATGADGVFVHDRDELPENLRSFAHPTVAGRQIFEGGIRDVDRYIMLVPYSMDGTLLTAERLGRLLSYLKQSSVRSRLEQRTCVTRSKSPKEWYAFHETPLLTEILRPKILCKDISPQPVFVPDAEGTIVPRHSAYYIVPRHPETLNLLLAHLKSPASADWLRANCQRAANRFLRLQSRVLKRLPIPDDIGEHVLDLDQREILTSAPRRAAI